MLRAIATAKKKNGRIDASKIADCLRRNFLPECCFGRLEQDWQIRPRESLPVSLLT
jgi:hypothetical protein